MKTFTEQNIELGRAKMNGRLVRYRSTCIVMALKKKKRNKNETGFNLGKREKKLESENEKLKKEERRT